MANNQNEQTGTNFNSKPKAGIQPGKGNNLQGNRQQQEFGVKSFNSDSKEQDDGVGFQDKILSKIAELGDLLERAGEKVESKGFESIGEAIYKLGNRLEHFKEGNSKNSSRAGLLKGNQADNFGKFRPSKDESQAI